MKAVCTTLYMHFASWRGIYRLYPRLKESKKAFVFFVKHKLQMEICAEYLQGGYSLLTGVETEGFCCSIVLVPTMVWFSTRTFSPLQYLTKVFYPQRHIRHFYLLDDICVRHFTCYGQGS